MACTLTQGSATKNCKASAGTKEVLIANYENVTSITKTAGVVTAITMTLGTQFFVYKQKAETANWTQTWTGDAKTGNGSYALTSHIELQGIDSAQQVELDKLARATTIQIVHDNDGNYYLLGDEYGMDTTTDALESGTALADFKGDKIDFGSVSSLRASTVTPSLIAALIIPAV